MSKDATFSCGETVAGSDLLGTRENSKFFIFLMTLSNKKGG